LRELEKANFTALQTSKSEFFKKDCFLTELKFFKPAEKLLDS